MVPACADPFVLEVPIEDSVPCAVGDGLVSFEEIVGERWVVPPWVVLAWLVVWDGEVCHAASFRFWISAGWPTRFSESR